MQHCGRSWGRLGRASWQDIVVVVEDVVRVVLGLDGREPPVVLLTEDGHHPIVAFVPNEVAVDVATGLMLQLGAERVCSLPRSIVIVGVLPEPEEMDAPGRTALPRNVAPPMSSAAIRAEARSLSVGRFMCAGVSIMAMDVACTAHVPCASGEPFISSASWLSYH